jgi:hypothetical protein
MAPLVLGQCPADGSHQRSGGQMPFRGIDLWRIQYFTHACSPAEVRIPNEDSDAWTLNPSHRWVYDRIAIHPLAKGGEEIFRNSLNPGKALDKLWAYWLIST